MNPDLVSCRENRSLSMPSRMSSLTSSPRAITSLACRPSGEPAATSARSRSPVEICGTCRCSLSLAACVPLPEPGAPNNTNRIGDSPTVTRPEAVADRCYARPSPRFVRHFNPSLRLADPLQRAPMAGGTLLYSQSGGATAVINATASGVIGEARARGIKVLAARNGILGALREELVDTSKETVATIRGLAHTPGGAFGSCRYKLKSVEADRAKY